MLPQSDDRLDQELAAWFCLREGAWSGTAAELLASLRTRADADSSLWPHSPRILYAHLQSHMQILRSLGVDVLLHHGLPRMVSLRSCHTGQPPSSPSDADDIDRTSDAPITLSSLVEGRKTNPAGSGDLVSIPSDGSYGNIPVDESEYPERSVKGKFANTDIFGGGIFENTSEALFALVEMKRRIREQNLDLDSTVDLVIGPAQEMTRCCGIAVGFLPRKRIGHLMQIGGYASTKGQHFHANLFQSSLVAGDTVQVRDAQQHPLLGAGCKREGIGSLIIVPIFRHQEVAGAMEFLFHEKRCFSSGDVMDLGLIAGVISESLGGAPQVGVKQAEGHECTRATEPVKKVKLQHEPRLKQKADPSEGPPSLAKDSLTPRSPIESSIPESVKMGSIASRLVTTPSLLWLAVKKACVRRLRARDL
jgi:hypothetical protein